MQNRTVVILQKQQRRIYEVGHVPKGLPHFFSLSVLSVQAVTGHLCLRAYLSGDGVEQGHCNSLSGLLESCYQVPHLTERPFLDAGISLKDEERGGRFIVFTSRMSSNYQNRQP